MNIFSDKYDEATFRKVGSTFWGSGRHILLIELH